MKRIPWIFGRKKPLVIYDTETTGSMASSARIVELAAIKLTPEEDEESGVLFMPDHYDEFCTLVDPGVHIPASATKFHGITDEDVKGAPSTFEVLSDFMSWSDENIITAYNLPFDRTVVNCEADREIEGDLPGVPLWTFCTLAWAQRMIDPRKTNSISLVDVTEYLGFEVKGAHEALGDVLMTYEILKYFIWEYVRDFGIKEQFEEWINTPQILPICTISKDWRGREWGSIPDYFINWIIDNLDPEEMKSADLVHTAKYHRDLRGG